LAYIGYQYPHTVNADFAASRPRGGITDSRPREFLPLRGLAYALTAGLASTIALAAARVAVTRLYSGDRPGQIELDIRPLAVLARITMAATILLFLIWFHRARMNAERSSWRQRRARAWTFWGWLVPIANLWIPFQLMGDIWRAALPTRQRARTAWLPALWWAAWLLTYPPIWSRTGSQLPGDWFHLSLFAIAGIALIAIIRTISRGPVGTKMPMRIGKPTAQTPDALMASMLGGSSWPRAGEDFAVPEFVLAHTQQWLEHFASEGHNPRPLAAGVEGAIYELGDGLIAKVWRDRRPAELVRMRSFYADVAGAGLPFSTPEILAVEQVEGTSVTYERKLPGEPLQQRIGRDDPGVDPAAARCVTEVLRALATVPATTVMRQLAVLDEDRPLWEGKDTFQDALLSLLNRRVTRFGHIIRRHLPDFDRRYARLHGRLVALPARPDAVIHGDLVTGNILVDEQTRPVAVLDFGFLTTAGDPRFDAAIAASVMNMYGPHAHAITDAATAQLAEDLGYPADVLLIYQAAYAVATSNAFTSDGSDGHFAWCIDQLRRPDITDLVAL
jgi:hypothetical protein